MPTTYPTELRVKTICRYEKGESIKALSEELHISQSTLYQWRKEFCSIRPLPAPILLPNLMLSAADRKSWSIKWRLSARVGICPVYPYSQSSRHSRSSIISLITLLAFMNYVTHLMWQGGLSITTFSAKQTGAVGTFLSSEIVSSCSKAEKRVKSLSYN